MRNRRISLQDIATLAGVTKMTMSHYIRSPKKVVKGTGERVAKIVEEINYIPNRAFDILSNTQSYTPGISIPSSQNQLFANIPAGMESVTSVHNRQIFVANYNYDHNFEEESVISLLPYSIDGVILSEKYHTTKTVKFLRPATILAMELIGVQGERLGMEVGFGNQQTVFDMMYTMLDKRVRRKILYLGPKGDACDGRRYQGYCDMVMLRSLSPLRMSSRTISSTHLGVQLMHDALNANPDLDGIFCTSDDTTMGALLLHRERNLVVPEQISVAGFHRLKVGGQVIPGLASVITPRFDIGRMAAQMLLSGIKNNDHNHNTVDLGYQIYHGSTLQVTFFTLHISSLPDIAYTLGRKLEGTS